MAARFEQSQIEDRGSSMAITQKRSAIPGKAPTPEQLALGELAVNTSDGKLFLKKNDGTEEIVEVGARWGDFTLGLVNTALVFRWNGTEVMRLDNSGNLTLSGNVTAFGDLS
jgi:hypothetical protein